MSKEEKEYHSILNSFDFTHIDELDPSLTDGFKLIYDREVPFELRIQENNEVPQEVGTLEAIRVKLLQQIESNAQTGIKIELTSESDLFFHYTHRVDESSYKLIQETQKLMIEFKDYQGILIKMLNSCIKEPNSFIAVFIMNKDGKGKLDFIQNMEYKFIELLTVNFDCSNEEIVKQHITYRYNALKSKLSILQGRLQDINSIIKIKNPSLLLQIQKNSNSSIMQKSTIKNS